MQKANIQDPKTSVQSSPSKKDDLSPAKKTLQELVHLRVERQAIVSASYDDLPVLEESKVKTFEDLSYKLSD